MGNFKVFGECEIPSFIPKSLLCDFSIVGMQQDSKYAINYTLSSLKQHKRIQRLILIFPHSLPTSCLAEIQKFHCKIYFFLQKDSKSFCNCKSLSQFGLVIAL